MEIIMIKHFSPPSPPKGLVKGSEADFGFGLCASIVPQKFAIPCDLAQVWELSSLPKQWT